MQVSHPAKNPSTVTVASASTGLSGPDAFRAYYFPRQILHLNEASQCLNMSYPHFFRRIRAGTLDLRIRKNEIGERFVLLEDLILYLFGPSTEQSPSPTPAKKKPGRPRKALSGQEGGAR